MMGIQVQVSVNMPSQFARLTAFLLLLLSFAASPAHSATYYVSNAGSDSNSGTSTSAPWQTLAKVNSTSFAAGDQILLRRGDTFYGSLTVNSSGTSTSRITFSAYGDSATAKPVITGFTTVGSWNNLGGNIWESAVAVSSLGTCNMVTINGVNTAMGRYPNADAANSGYLAFQSHSGSTSITSSSLSGTPNWTGAEVAIRSQAFHWLRSKITAQSGGTLTFNAISDTPSNGNGFFIESDIRTLDQQNEWYYNPTTGKLSVYSTTQPTNVQLTTVENLITSNGNYLTYSNLSLVGANSCGFYGSSSTHNYVTVDSCSVSYVGISGVYTPATNYLMVSNNTIVESNGGAIETVNGNNDTISGNTIQKIGLFPGMKIFPAAYSYGNSAVDCAFGSNWTVQNNSIVNVGFNGISFWNGNTRTIRNNYVDTFCSILDDGAAIYTYTATGGSNSNVLITGNVIRNGIGAINGSAWNVHTASGVYLDQGSNNMEVSYNSMADLSWFGMQIVSSGNINVHHNTVYNASVFECFSAFWGMSGTTPTTTDQINNNVFVAKYSGRNLYVGDEQHCLGYYFSTSNPQVSVTAATSSQDYNYYARPIADSTTIWLNLPNPSDCAKTLAAWQTMTGKDSHSHTSPMVVNDVNNLSFVYNETSVAKTIPLPNPVLALAVTTGGVPSVTSYSGSITLQPYTSAILFNNPIISFSASAYSVAENAGTATITARRTGSSSGSVSVSYATSNGTATAGSDYTAKSGTLTWADGDTADKTFTVAITNDTLNEPNETVNLALSNPVNGTLGTLSSAVLTILDDDAPPTVNFAPASQSKLENAGTATVTAQLSAASAQTVTVPFTIGGTATSPTDYTISPASAIAIPAGSTSGAVTITIVNRTTSDPDRTVVLTMGTPTNATKGTSAVSTLTITDTAAPQVQGVRINDGNAQRSMVNDLTVTFSKPVTLAANAIVLQQHGGGTVANVAVTTSNPSGDGTTYRVGFSGTAIVGGSLPDGIYDLSLKASSITDVSGQPLSGGDQTFTFHRLLGDGNGDKVVDLSDFTAFRAAYTTRLGQSGYLNYFDFDSSGIIDLTDFTAFRSNYTKRLNY